MIQDVTIKKLNQFPDHRGNVMHMLRRTDESFSEFGEIYFSIVRPGAVKAWRMHKESTQNYAVPIGKLEIVLYDDRSGSKTRGEVQSLVTGPDNYLLVTIPPGVWTGFKGLGATDSLLANCSSMEHDDAEILRCDWQTPHIPYEW